MKMRKFLRIIQQKLLEVKMNNIFPNENEKIFKNYTTETIGGQDE